MKIIESCVSSFRLLLTCLLIAVIFGGAVTFNLEEWSPGGKVLLMDQSEYIEFR